MRLFRTGWLVALAVALGSCLNHEFHAFDNAIDAARSDLGAHHRVVVSAESMAAAQSELDRHAAEIHADVSDVRRRLSDFDGSCDSDDLDRVWDTIHAIEDRIAVYLLDAGKLTDLPALRAVADRYAADLDRLFDDAQDRLDDAWCW